MGKRFVCNFSKEQLQSIYEQEGMTLKKLCKIVGCKSEITMSKIMHENGIDTNQNAKRAMVTKGNRTDKEFKEFLISEYVIHKRSVNSIAKELGVCYIIVVRYLDKYGIRRRTKSEQQIKEHAVNWKGGKHKTSHGYIEIYCPDHPKASVRKTIYEHTLVAEKKLNRYLRDGETVHHIDYDKTNNNPENLIVLTNPDHARLHSLLRHGKSFADAIKEVHVINE